MTTHINKPHDKQPFRKMARAFLLFAAAFTAMGLMMPAQAQDKTLTLDEAIKLGIQNSKVLKLSQSKIDEAVSQYNQAKDQVLPTGKASFGYDRAQIPANMLDLGPKESISLPSGANAYL